MAIARPGPTATAGIASYEAPSTFTANPKVPFGSDLDALQLDPQVSLVIKDLHIVLDGAL
jgi:hypothetical protein